MLILNAVGIEWDAGNRDKCQKHGVSIHELETMFIGTIAIFPDPVHSIQESRFIAIGQTDTGRHIFVAFTLRRHNKEIFIRPISARYMHPKEIAHYAKTIAKT